MKNRSSLLLCITATIMCASTAFSQSRQAAELERLGGDGGRNITSTAAAAGVATDAANTAAIVQPEASAATPRVIRYAGILKDISGQALSGATSITFALYADQNGT